MDVARPHSIYLVWLAEHGICRLALYLLLLFTICSACIDRAETPSFGVRAVLWVRVMFQFSLVAFMVVGAFLGRAYF